MNAWAWTLAISVGLVNIAFNAQAQRAAKSAESWGQGVISLEFLLLFVIGCVSLLLLYTLYSLQVPLARAILLMGAVSIVGGTMFGIAFRGNRIDAIEWCLFGVITLLLCYRLFRSLLSAN
jgi:glucan phosphoethanolaminetransferase (alkaline phosphatase superfamily)